jgi:precorrin-2 dehydrogenase/sirohydrochlorin ferrochelatase
MVEKTGGSYYPVFLDLRGRRCVVVGGGEVALRKVDGLLAAGAKVTVVAPRIHEMPPGVTVLQRGFAPADLDGAFFAISATDDRAVNSAVAAEAEARGIPVNVVDVPAESSVILPAVVRRGEFVLAVSTGGASPAFARLLRERLEAEFGEEYGELIAFLKALRQAWEPCYQAEGIPHSARKAAWERVLDLPLLDWLRAGQQQQAKEAAEEVLARVLITDR